MVNKHYNNISCVGLNNYKIVFTFIAVECSKVTWLPIANTLVTLLNCNLFFWVLFLVWRDNYHFCRHWKFVLTIFSTPNIIVPVFSVQPQQNLFSIIAILARQIKPSSLRETTGGNIFCIKTFYTNQMFRFLGYYIEHTHISLYGINRPNIKVRSILTITISIHYIIVCTVRAVPVKTY